MSHGYFTPYAAAFMAAQKEFAAMSKTAGPISGHQAGAFNIPSVQDYSRIHEKYISELPNCWTTKPDLNPAPGVPVADDFKSIRERMEQNKREEEEARRKAEQESAG